MDSERDGKPARRSQNRCDMIALSLPRQKAPQQQSFETAAGGGRKIDQQQNTGNDSNPEHEQQTCGSLSPDGLRGRRVFNVPPPTVISWEKHRVRFPREAKFNKERKKKSRSYLILKTFSSLCPIMLKDSPSLSSETLIACAVQSANGRLSCTLVLMTMKEAQQHLFKDLISFMKWWHIWVVVSLLVWGEDAHMWFWEGKKKPPKKTVH